MKTIYRLHDNHGYIKAVQEASLHRQDAGLKITHGLLASDEWWKNVVSGRLPTITVRGVISAVFMSGHNDWPEFEITSDTGEKSRWTREVSDRSLDSEYQQWRRVELDYVVQKFKRPLLESQIVLEIRIET